MKIYRTIQDNSQFFVVSHAKYSVAIYTDSIFIDVCHFSIDMKTGHFIKETSVDSPCWEFPYDVGRRTKKRLKEIEPYILGLIAKIEKEEMERIGIND